MSVLDLIKYKLAKRKVYKNAKTFEDLFNYYCVSEVSARHIIHEYLERVVRLENYCTQSDNPAEITWLYKNIIEDYRIKEKIQRINYTLKKVQKYAPIFKHMKNMDMYRICKDVERDMTMCISKLNTLNLPLDYYLTLKKTVAIKKKLNELNGDFTC